MAHPVTPIKSRSVLGATELTLMAPIKRGLIPALDSRSYRSRAKIVLDTLHALGVSRREIDPTPAIIEVADTIRAIRSFRLSIVGESLPQVLLSVSFDGGWEPYMRRIWRPLGPLLDLIFCNCDGYLLSSKHGYPAYARWVKQAQVETSFYYEGSALTVSDQHFLKEREGRPTPAEPASAGTLHEQARAALVAFYRLTDMFPDRPDHADGDVLRRAARLLLGDLSADVKSVMPDGVLRTDAEKEAWRWFGKDLPEVEPPDRLLPVSPGITEPVALANVQGGILEPYPDLVQGRLVLVRLKNAAAVERFIKRFQEGGYAVTPASPPYKSQGPLFVNLAFTYAGLSLAGVDPGTLEQLPQEFREGMEARAGVLGDWERNHPQHWALPLRYGGKGSERIQLSVVHAVVQFWLAADQTELLDSAVKELDEALKAVDSGVVAVQPMRRLSASPGAIRGHFGFVDGISQPGLGAADRLARDTVAPGDLLLGYRNGRNDKPLEGRLWKDSTFLVLRKLRQDVQAFGDLVKDDGAKAALMGRRLDGSHLIDTSDGGDTTINNDFDYTNEKDNLRCPLFAHVRRANPRAERKNELDHLPRIVRRGMSYGPQLDGMNADEERGLMFMAYNASIAEQFEVVQGWLAGGNSGGPGSFSGLRDPFVGVAREGDPRRFEWPQGKSVDLPGDRPLVTLEWGLYAFVPSLSALNELGYRARERALEDEIDDIDDPLADAGPDAQLRKRDRRNREQARQAALGSALIAGLQQVELALGFDAAVEHWKIALEDMGARMSGRSQAIWTAVRQAHRGALRSPYGVLVCSKTLVEQVFANADSNYTVSGYNARLAKSFGEIYLGRDDGEDYRGEAGPANEAIMAVTQEQAFDSAFGHTGRLLEEFSKKPPGGDDIAVEVKDLVDEVLARVSEEWFGLPDEIYVKRGGWHWRDEATCPGHFHAPSRYTFQPNPGKQAAEVGEAHGSELKKQVLQYVEEQRGKTSARGRLGAALFSAFDDDERLSSTLIGVMMGFLPTVDGNLRGALYEWVSDRSLWDHQAVFRALASGSPLERAHAVLREPLFKTMQLRPVPEVVWRTALRDHKLGHVDIRAGDTVVISIVSATQDDLLNGREDPFIVFGGKRKRDDADGKPVPTHACPGYDMAVGVMLGFLAALMDAVSLRPAISPMALRIGKR